MKIIEIDINKLLPAEYNPRIQLKPGDKAYNDLKNSIEKFGYVELIIINREFKIIAGHQRIPVLKELGYSNIKAIQLDINENEEKALNIALNKIDGEWNFDKLTNLLSEIKINDSELFNFTGFDDGELESLMKEFSLDKNSNSSGESTSGTGENNYTDKIKAPIYEPKQDKPPELKDMINCEKAIQLIREIKDQKFEKNLEDFLVFAAYRFIVFNYENIAEFYCHSDKNLQEIMEKLAMVIIDFDKAIEYGLTEFANDIYKDVKEEGEEIVTE